MRVHTLRALGAIVCLSWPLFDAHAATESGASPRPVIGVEAMLAPGGSGGDEVSPLRVVAQRSPSRVPAAPMSSSWSALQEEGAAARGGVLYVDADAPPSGDGSSWSEAFRDLQQALAAARLGGVAQIWVAEGTYFPDSGSNRDASFELFGTLELLGGFAGNENNPEERDPAAHPTLLSGDLSENDLPGFGNRADNSRHVVTAFEPDGARIDGFVIERGNADFDGDLLIGGGGMFVLSTGGPPSIEGGSPHRIDVIDCTFRLNSAGQTFQELGNFGGGLLVRGTDANIIDCRFEDNRANAGGGLGLFDRDATDTDVDMIVFVTDCLFARNDVPTQGGGAIWSAMGRSATGDHEGSLTVSGCRFEDNHAGYWGAWIDQNTTFLTVQDCEFFRNASDVTGGALGHIQTAGADTSPLRVERSTFAENVTDGAGAGAWLGAADATFRHCRFLGNLSGGGAAFSSGYFQPAGARDFVFENCLFQGNKAADAGAILSGFNPVLRVVNSTIANNESLNGVAGGIFTRAGLVDIDSVILHGNRGVSGVSQTTQFQAGDAGVIQIDYALLQGWNGTLGGTGNFSGDPSFLDPLGPDGIEGTGDEDFRIDAGSSCIDAGSNSAVPPGLDLDLGGDPRRVDDPSVPDTGEGTAPIVDIGAYEFQGGTTGVSESIPGLSARLQVWPNPASGTVHLGFTLARASFAGVSVYDASGRVVARPWSGPLPAGAQQIEWNGQLESGRMAPAGVYLARVELRDADEGAGHGTAGSFVIRR